MARICAARLTGMYLINIGVTLCSSNGHLVALPDACIISVPHRTLNKPLASLPLPSWVLTTIAIWGDNSLNLPLVFVSADVVPPL